VARIRHSVPMVRQGHSPVCWLACATMLYQYKRGQTPTARTMGMGGVDFRRGVANRQSMPSDAPTGAQQHAWLRRLGFRVVRSSELVEQTTTPSHELIYNLLERHGPFVLNHNCGAFWYGQGVPVPTTGGHSVLVTGMDTEAGGCWFNNPWGTANVMTTTDSLVGAINRWENNASNKSFYLLP